MGAYSRTKTARDTALKLAVVAMTCVWLLSPGAVPASAAELKPVSANPAPSQTANSVRQGETAKPKTECPPKPKALPVPTVEKLPSGSSSGTPEGIAGTQGRGVKSKTETE